VAVPELFSRLFFPAYLRAGTLWQLTSQCPHASVSAFLLSWTAGCVFFPFPLLFPLIGDSFWHDIVLLCFSSVTRVGRRFERVYGLFAYYVIFFQLFTILKAGAYSTQGINTPLFSLAFFFLCFFFSILSGACRSGYSILFGLNLKP